MSKTIYFENKIFKIFKQIIINYLFNLFLKINEQKCIEISNLNATDLTVYILE